MKEGSRRGDCEGGRYDKSLLLCDYNLIGEWDVKEFSLDINSPRIEQ
jgi:hypothetical protein